MSGLSLRPTLQSFITFIVTAFFAVFLFALPAQSAQGEAYLIVPDMVLGNVEGTEEVFSSLYTELEKQGVPAENIVNFRYDPYDGITEINQQLTQTLTTLETETGDTEISVLGYGVGGLIVRNYLESDSYTDNIESVVFSATPHEGTIAYTEHIYGKNITYLNAWERLYWEGKDVPMLMKQVLPTNLPLVGISLEDEVLTPLREAVTYSIIDDLKNREVDPESPIKNLQITNLRPSGYRDGWYFTPTRIRIRYETTLTSVRQQTLEGDLVLELERGVGDGYVSKNGGSFTEGTTRDYWAEHTDFLHQGIRDIISGLGLSTDNVDQYHNGRLWYEYKGGPYPKSYHAVAFKTDVSEDLELISLDTSTIENVQRYEEAGRVILFGTALIQGQVEARIESHARQDIYLTTFLANPREHITYPIHTFQSEVGERFTFTYDLKPYCSTQSWQTTCSLLSNDAYPYNVWQETSREWIQYPIVLVHGILGSINADMLFSLEKDSNTGTTGADFEMKGFNPTGDTISGEEWYTIPFLDKTWDRMIPTLESGGLQQNEDFFVFSYDWRYPNQVSAYRLQEYIERVQTVTGSRKVSIVAHSMGGLVARAYIEDMANPLVRYDGSVTYENESLRVPYQNNIARFVMAGTPNMGSGTAIPRWYGGDTISGNIGFSGIGSYYGMQWYLDAISPDFGKEVVRKLPFGQIIQRPFAKDQLRREAPATRDLLPTYDQTMLARVHTPTLLNPANFEETWLPRITENVFLDTMNSRSNSEDSNLKNIDTLAIAGVGQDTIKEVHFLKENAIWQPLNILYHPWSAWGIINNDETYWFDKLVKTKEGDATVLVDSVQFTDQIKRENVNINDPEREVNNKHGELYLNSEILSHTLSHLKKVSNSSPNSYRLRIQNGIVINIYSPADISVTLEDGTVISKDVPESEMIERGIVYTSQGEGGHKSLFIPNISEGEYEIEVTGTGEGEYTLQTKYANETGQVVYDRVEGETSDGKEESYNFNIEKDEEGNVSEEAITLVPANTPPVAVLDKDLYEGLEGDEITFDESSSTNEDGDTLQYRWTITDEEEVTSEITIRAMNFGEKVEQIRNLIYSLDEDTSYIRAKKRLWLQLVDLLNLPQVQNSDRLIEIIIELLERDIERSLWIDRRFERAWMWWRRTDLITDKNEQILRDVQEKTKEI